MPKLLRRVAAPLLISASAGVVVAVAFTLVALGAISMAGGDGTAPAITHFMLRLIDIPVKLLGLSHEDSVRSAGVFWGAVSAIAVLFLGLVVLALQALFVSPNRRAD